MASSREGMQRLRSLRRVLAGLAFGAILVGGFELFFVRIYTIDRAALGRHLAGVQYRKVPGLQPFLVNIRARVPAGSDIALITSRMDSWPPYEYVFARSMYPLAGRRLVALMDENGSHHPERLAEVEYVMAWKLFPEITGYELVWRSRDGALLRRRR